MVLRKPTMPSTTQAPANPPYPVTPTTENPPALPAISTSNDEVYSPDLNKSPAFKLSTLDTAKQLREQTASEKAESSEDEWNTDSFDELDDDDDDFGQASKKKDDLPATLKVGGPSTSAGAAKPEETLPSALRVGPPDGAARRSPSPHTQNDLAPIHYGSAGSSSSSVPLQSHNPYLKFQHSGQSSVGAESSSAVWDDSRSQNNPFTSNSHPVELPADKTPIDQVSKLSLHNDLSSPPSRLPPSIPVQPDGPTEGFGRSEMDRDHSHPGGTGVSLLNVSSLNGPVQPILPDESAHNPWQDPQERQQRELAAAHEAAKKQEDERRAEEARAASLRETVREEIPPPLPPRTYTEDLPPPKPPRPVVDTSQGGVSRQEVETPGTQANRQRKEHYQIKNIRWFDSKTQSLRQSPILTQNANGPCPLLALVNALVLSTPSGVETALVETLRSREQVTLGLLLDAVFDELMSGRRGGAAQELPDVGELYSFLITLHTGMNVNPRFVKPLSDAGSRNSGHFHPAVRGQAQPGGFERTKEMNLYSTFNIPLLHGWLPPGESRAYAAFDRVAKTYEDAHAFQFQEEELESKMRAGGLSQDEQRLYEDLHVMKDFLLRWPTQLTDFGLQVLSNSLEPGQVAILFRNDHFSTLYKEPRTGQIMTLVTDAGYSRHEEIVWETLVDVNGQGSELYSGDFRPVGNMSDNVHQDSSQERPIRSLLDDDDQGWTTVENRNQRGNSNQASTVATTTTDPLSTDSQRIEQEDHDLALALQLQEEEEDRHRRELQARRRRENDLNEQFLSAEQQRNSSRNGNGSGNGNSNNNAPLIPPRRNRTSTAHNVNQPSSRTNEDDLPPPTYEQAASGRPYHPPPGHPASPNAPIGGRRPQQGQSAYNSMSNTMSPSGPHGRRPSGLVNQIPPNNGRYGPGRRYSSSAAGHQQPREEKCTVM